MVKNWRLWLKHPLAMWHATHLDDEEKRMLREARLAHNRITGRINCLPDEIETLRRLEKYGLIKVWPPSGES